MILLSASFDPMIVTVSVLALLSMTVGLLLKQLKQPYIVGYILIGAMVGKDGLGLVDDPETISHIGETGIIMLLFFIGMEISLPDFLKSWKLSLISTVAQVVLSSGVMLAVGYIMGWNYARSIVLAFVVALSSSAVVIKLLEDKKLISTKLGKGILSILLTQDIVLVPMLIITTFLGGKSESMESILLMLVGGLFFMGLLLYMYIKKEIQLPFTDRMKEDHELQVFAGIVLCFGGALISAFFGLSAGLGAFIGGMAMNTAKATHWLYSTLHSFRVLFVAFFFISIGLQIDFTYIYDHAVALAFVLVSVYVVNHLINTLIIRSFSFTWHEAILGGALLAQIGEMSFLVASSALSLGIIGDYGYKFTISLISLTLVISPFWISGTERLIKMMSRS